MTSDKKPPPREPTERIRVRSKNPQIGRKRTDPGSEDATAIAEEVRPRELFEDEATEVLGGPPRAGAAAVMRATVPREAPERSHTTRDRGPTRKLTPRPQPEREARAPKPPAEPEARLAKPRARMEQLGTDGAGLIAQKAKIARAEGMLTATKSAALKPYRGRVDDRALAALDRALAGELEGDLAANASPKRALERVIYSPAFERLGVEESAILLGALGASPRELEAMRAAARLLEGGVLERLASEERAALFSLFRALRPAQLSRLAELAERPLHGRSALEDRDLEDGALLVELEGWARLRALSPRVESAGCDLQRALDHVLAAIASPATLPLEEGADGVLGGIEFGLADASPAEYVRLWRGLTTGDLVATLPGGAQLDLSDLLRTRGAQFRGRESPLRFGLEALVGLAHPRSGPNRSGLIMPGGHGLDADVCARVLGQLYGVGVTVAAGATAALRHLDRLRPESDRVPPAFVTLLYDGGERLFVFDRLSQGRAFLRAPHGDSSKPRGSRRPEPLRLVEDPERGLESLSTQELGDVIGVALVPRT